MHLRKPRRMQHYAFTVLCMFLFISCKKEETVQPPPPKDPRTYTWTVDTISYPGSFQTGLIDIWGSSPTDVYAVGHTDLIAGHMFHYDGMRWGAVRLTVPEGGTIPQGIDLRAVFGFNKNDIYVVGYRNYYDPITQQFSDSSLIIHYDGSQWREVTTKPSRYLNTVFGASPTDVWAGGEQGSLYHYDGITWSKVIFDTTLFLAKISGRGVSDLYGIAIRVDQSPYDTTNYLLFHYDGRAWLPIDSFMITPQMPTWKFGFSLWTSPTGKTYSAAYGVYLKEGSSWRQMFYNDWPTRIQGYTDNNIFAFGDRGRVFHWNGLGWKKIDEIEAGNHIFRSAWVFETEVFILGEDGRQTYIAHGK